MVDYCFSEECKYKCEVILVKKSLNNSILDNLIFAKLPIIFFFPIIGIFFYIYRVRYFKSEKINKRNGILDLIEAIIMSYNKTIANKNKKKLNLINFHQKINKRLKLSFLKDDLQLGLLRNLLYRILDKYIIQSNIGELVKMEILKAPERTFSDFVYLYDEIRKELKLVS